MTEQTHADDQFPTIVYKGRGPHSRAGGTFDYSSANDQEELETKLANGWYATLPEAIEAHDNPDAAPPTRDELEAKAKELGIQFNGKTTDAQLGKLITKKLGG